MSAHSADTLNPAYLYSAYHSAEKVSWHLSASVTQYTGRTLNWCVSMLSWHSTTLLRWTADPRKWFLHHIIML